LRARFLALFLVLLLCGGNSFAYSVLTHEEIVDFLRENILHFYSDLSVSIETKKDAGHWQELLADLDKLKSATPVLTVAGGLAK
jgi:hypothetical protein